MTNSHMGFSNKIRDCENKYKDANLEVNVYSSLLRATHNHDSIWLESDRNTSPAQTKPGHHFRCPHLSTMIEIPPIELQTTD